MSPYNLSISFIITFAQTLVASFMNYHWWNSALKLCFILLSLINNIKCMACRYMTCLSLLVKMPSQPIFNNLVSVLAGIYTISHNSFQHFCTSLCHLCPGLCIYNDYIYVTKTCTCWMYYMTSNQLHCMPCNELFNFKFMQSSHTCAIITCPNNEVNNIGRIIIDLNHDMILDIVRYVYIQQDNYYLWQGYVESCVSSFCSCIK